MKIILSVGISLLCCFAISCKSTQPVVLTDADKLSDLLRNVSGLSVIGKGEYATLRVRGLAEYHGDGEPLIVLNGIDITGGFNSLANRVRAEDITSVNVLRYPLETVKYGPNAVNGVVEIYRN